MLKMAANRACSQHSFWCPEDGSPQSMLTTLFLVPNRACSQHSFWCPEAWEAMKSAPAITEGAPKASLTQPAFLAPCVNDDTLACRRSPSIEEYSTYPFLYSLSKRKTKNSRICFTSIPPKATISAYLFLSVTLYVHISTHA